MVGIGIVLLIVGALILVVTLVAKLPAVVHTVSIVLLVLGGVFVLLGLLQTTLHTTTDDYGHAQPAAVAT